MTESEYRTFFIPTLERTNGDARLIFREELLDDEGLSVVNAIELTSPDGKQHHTEMHDIDLISNDIRSDEGINLSSKPRLIARVSDNRTGDNHTDFKVLTASFTTDLSDKKLRVLGNGFITIALDEIMGRLLKRPDTVANTPAAYYWLGTIAKKTLTVNVEIFDDEIHTINRISRDKEGL